MNKPADFSVEKAEKTALKLLRLRQSRQSLEGKLRKKGFDRAVVLEIADKMERLGYINDRDYAKAFVHDSMLLRRYGPKKIRMSLYQRGISGEIINWAIDEAEEEIHLDNIRFLMLKEFGGETRVDAAIAGKFQRKMLNRGFLMTQIEEVMQEITVKLQEEDGF